MDDAGDFRVEITGMDISHLDEVFEIEKYCFVSPWSKDSLRKEIEENERAAYIVAKHDGRVVGYAGMWHVVNEGHITNVAVGAEHRRRGVGGMLVARLIEIARARGMLGITLEVRISNLHAQRLYSKFGFIPEGFRKEYYDDTHEDAVIMWKYFDEVNS